MVSIILPAQYNRKPPNGTRPDYTHPLMRDLAAWWPFLEGAGDKVLDYSGHNSTGTLTGMSNSDWLTGNPRYGGFALDFTTNKYINMGDAAPLKITNHLTLMGWFRLNDTSPPNKEYYIASKDDDNKGRSYNLSFINNPTNPLQDKVLFAFINGGGGNDEIIGTTKLSAGVWYHGAVTFSDQKLNLFLNGLKDAAEVTTDSASINDSTAEFRIGAREFRDEEDWMNGQIDNVLCAKKAWTRSEIWQAVVNPWAPFRMKRIFGVPFSFGFAQPCLQSADVFVPRFQNADVFVPGFQNAQSACG